MFNLKFPSGSTITFGESKPDDKEEYQGTLYIWLEDLEPLVELEQEQKDKEDDTR